MGIESKNISVESFTADITQKDQERSATSKITEGFEGDVNRYGPKAKEQKAAREKIENETVEIIVAALPVLGYETVMQIIENNTSSVYVDDLAMNRLRGKVLKRMTENMMQKAPESEVPGRAGIGSRARDVLGPTVKTSGGTLGIEGSIVQIRVGNEAQSVDAGQPIDSGAIDPSED